MPGKLISAGRCLRLSCEVGAVTTAPDPIWFSSSPSITKLGAPFEDTKTIMSSTDWLIWLRPDGSNLSLDDVIAVGKKSIVVRHTRTTVLKIARRKQRQPGNLLSSEEDLIDDSNEVMLLSELAAYRRLRGRSGIAEFHGFLSGGIALHFYPTGSLESFVSSAQKPPLHARIRWMTEAARIVKACHDARVLLFDIALRNFVIAEDGTLAAIDFAQAVVLPTNTDMSQANDDGLTTRIDIFHLGGVLYSLSIWSRMEMDCDDEEHWPSLQGFPDTTGIPWASLIEDAGSDDSSLSTVSSSLVIVHVQESGSTEDVKAMNNTRKCRDSCYNGNVVVPSKKLPDFEDDLFKAGSA